jgi:Tol biopolymer transport system component
LSIYGGRGSRSFTVHMALTAGTNFGPYEIAESIGSGGMGEVYRATDTNLKRDVAIKVLPESFANDTNRLARFQREAEVLASLNHPNIAQIYGLERSDAATALVMELVEGPTLADRIAQGPLRPEEALSIAHQMADALEAAHEQHIVHRDLKPANIKLRPDGTVKVLDFGIAKALDPQSGGSGPQAPQLTTPAMTQAGIILGTAAYMSPEQARGKPVDKRTDIWAFGCVLYEMLTGQPAFAGEDVAVTLARIIANDTDMKSMPGTISPAVRQTIALCLEKDVRRRIRDIGDVKLALDGAFDIGGLGELGGRGAVAVARPWPKRMLPLAGALVIGALLVGLAGFALWPESGLRLVNRFSYVVPPDQPWRGTAGRLMNISPDGRSIVYNAANGLHIRNMGELEDRLVPGTNEPMIAPVFSPDGQSLAYFSNGQLKRIAVTGGASVVISDLSTGGLLVPAASWEADGSLLFANTEGIFRVPATGGTPELIIPSNDDFFYGPELLPDGNTVLFNVVDGGSSRAADQIVAQSIATGERTVVVTGGSDARYVPTGHIVYAFEDGLFGIAFDAANLQVSGGAVPLVQGIARASGSQPAANYAIADDGTLAYVRGNFGVSGLRRLVWVDREGYEEPIEAPPRAYVYAQLSPDDTRIVLDIRDQENDIWVWDIERKTLQRLTFDPDRNRGVVWSPDGERVAFSREIDGGEEIYWQASDGSGLAEPLTEGSGKPLFPVDITPDGTTLLYAWSDLPRDILMVPIAGAPTAGTPILDGPANEGSPTVSPDGRWLAYTSDESGDYEVYVRPFPNVNSGRWQISTAGGFHPHWSRDGTELFYMAPRTDSNALMTVAVDSGTTFRPGAPELLFEGRYWDAGGGNAGPGTFDVSRDGQRFLMIRDADEGRGTEEPEIVIVQNWFEELKRLVPTN